MSVAFVVDDLVDDLGCLEDSGRESAKLPGSQGETYRRQIMMILKRTMSHLSVPVWVRVVATLDMVPPPNEGDFPVERGKKRVKRFRLWRYFRSTTITRSDPVVRQIATVEMVSIAFVVLPLTWNLLIKLKRTR